MTWHRVANQTDCPDGASEHVVAGRIVAIFRAGETITALDGVCPHQGGPLGQGTLVEGGADALGGRPCYVTCPWHGWQFDVSTGEHRTSPLRHPAWETKVEAGAVYVDLPEDAS